MNNWDEACSEHMENCPHVSGNPWELLDPDPTEYRPRGKISNILFKDITVLKCDFCEFVVMGDSASSQISDVTFDNVVVKGQKLTAASSHVHTNEYVTGFKVI
jgi:hypothetical protein